MKFEIIYWYFSLMLITWVENEKSLWYLEDLIPNRTEIRATPQPSFLKIQNCPKLAKLNVCNKYIFWPHPLDIFHLTNFSIPPSIRSFYPPTEKKNSFSQTHLPRARWTTVHIFILYIFATRSSSWFFEKWSDPVIFINEASYDDLLFAAWAPYNK